MPVAILPVNSGFYSYYVSTNATTLHASWTNTTQSTSCNPIIINTGYGNQSTATTATAFTTSSSTSISPFFITGYQLTPQDEVLARKRQAIYQRERQRKIERAKGSIKRALKLIDGVGFGNDIRIFLRGDSIEISHPESLFKFVMHKSSYGSIVDKTINSGIGTPYALDLYTKTDVFIASLCVYLKDTPILDQVFAISMFIKSGDEDIILKQANWFSLTDDEDTVLEVVVNHPELEDKLRLSRFGPRLSMNH